MNTLAAITIPIPGWHIIHHRAHAIGVNAYVATITDYDLVVIYFYVAPALFLNEVLKKLLQSKGQDYTEKTKFSVMDERSLESIFEHKSRGEIATKENSHKRCFCMDPNECMGRH